jgi:hypothetical protein
MPDDRLPPPQPRWTPVGQGHHCSFLCPKCGQKRDTFGRRLRRWAGLRTWICALCIAAVKGGAA